MIEWVRCDAKEPLFERPPLCGGEAMALQDVVGERVPEHDRTDLFSAAYGQLPQVPIAPAGMDAFADRAEIVLRLACFAGHPRPPSQHAWAVSSPRQIGVGAVLRLRWRTINLGTLVVSPLDVICAAEAA